MADLKRQSICVTFCLKLRETVPEPQEKKETWLYSYGPETKQQFSSQCQNLVSSRPTKKVRCENIRNLFLQINRVTSIITGRLLSVWRSNFAENVRNEGGTSTWFTTAMRRRQCFASATITGRRNIPAVSPPLHPQPPLFKRPISFCHFVLLRRLKSQLKGCCYENVPEIQEQLTVLHEPPKSQFQWYFQQWQICWNHCINSEVNY